MSNNGEPGSEKQGSSDCRVLATGKETFWIHEAGLIVLEAEGKFFCAHRSVLCHESPIFRDILSLPQPEILDKNEQYEGKPLIRLSDKAEELQCFLEALHRYCEYYNDPISELPSSKAAILRLSHKYDVAHLRKRTIKELGCYLPTSLEEYDEWHRKRMKLEEHQDEIEPSLLSAVEEAGVQRFLPFIKYLQCTRTRISRLRFGNDDTVSAAIPTLVIRQFEINHMMTSPSCADLDVPHRTYLSSCGAAMHACFRTSLLTSHLDPLDITPIFRRAEITSGTLCDSCKSASQSSFDDNRWRLWNDLPIIFGLPPWEELLEDI